MGQAEESYGRPGESPQEVEDEVEDDMAEQESLEMLVRAQREEVEALTVIAMGQRILREAREAQSETRLGWGYHKLRKPKGGTPQGQGDLHDPPGKDTHHPSGLRKPKCVKCGGEHWMSVCPEKGVKRHTRQTRVEHHVLE